MTFLWNRGSSASETKIQSAWLCKEGDYLQPRKDLHEFKPMARQSSDHQISMTGGFYVQKRRRFSSDCENQIRTTTSGPNILYSVTNCSLKAEIQGPRRPKIQKRMFEGNTHRTFRILFLLIFQPSATSWSESIKSFSKYVALRLTESRGSQNFWLGAASSRTTAEPLWIMIVGISQHCSGSQA